MEKISNEYVDIQLLLAGELGQNVMNMLKHNDVGELQSIYFDTYSCVEEYSISNNIETSFLYSNVKTSLNLIKRLLNMATEQSILFLVISIDENYNEQFIKELVKFLCSNAYFVISFISVPFELLNDADTIDNINKIRYFSEGSFVVEKKTDDIIDNNIKNILEVIKYTNDNNLPEYDNLLDVLICKRGLSRSLISVNLQLPIYCDLVEELEKEISLINSESSYEIFVVIETSLDDNCVRSLYIIQIKKQIRLFFKDSKCSINYSFIYNDTLCDKINIKLFASTSNCPKTLEKLHNMEVAIEDTFESIIIDTIAEDEKNNRESVISELEIDSLKSLNNYKSNFDFSIKEDVEEWEEYEKSHLDLLKEIKINFNEEEWNVFQEYYNSNSDRQWFEYWMKHIKTSRKDEENPKEENY